MWCGDISHSNMMTMPQKRNDSILILGESASDTDVVASVLRLEYTNLGVCSDPDAFCRSFDKVRPLVLLLAFKSLDLCESVYLNLHRRSSLLHGHIHKTIVLCSKEQVHQAYKLCREGVFDDYALFWPLVHDVKRLPMSVHLALQTLRHMETSRPWEEMAALARRAEHLGDRLSEQIVQGRTASEGVKALAARAEVLVNGAITHFTKGFVDSVVGDPSLIQSRERAEQEARRVGDAVLAPAVEELLASRQPMQKWVETITDELEEQLGSMQEMARQAGQLSTRILLVDDDEFIRRIIAQMLRQAGFEVHSVSTLESARQVLKAIKPDLLLLDYELPDGTGLDLLREVRASPALQNLSVVILTGKSDRQVIFDCVSQGAADFIVKPVQQSALLSKIRAHLNRSRQEYPIRAR